jgi:hypothetical protein
MFAQYLTCRVTLRSRIVGVRAKKPMFSEIRNFERGQGLGGSLAGTCFALLSAFPHFLLESTVLMLVYLLV